MAPVQSIIPGVQFGAPFWTRQHDRIREETADAHRAGDAAALDHLAGEAKAALLTVTRELAAAERAWLERDAAEVARREQQAAAEAEAAGRCTECGSAFHADGACLVPELDDAARAERRAWNPGRRRGVRRNSGAVWPLADGAWLWWASDGQRVLEGAAHTRLEAEREAVNTERQMRSEGER